MNPLPRRAVTAPRLLMVAAVLTVTACSSSQLGTTTAARGGVATAQASGSTGSATSAPPPSLSVTPKDQSNAVLLSDRVTVTTNGALDSVVVSPAGVTAAPLPGSMDAAGRTWTSSGGLAPSTTYVVRATAHNGSGDASTQASFVTIAAKRLTTTPTPADGSTVGVGMPIKLLFNAPVDAAKQAALVSHVVVTTTPAVNGAWHWFSPTEVHWRPENLWPAGTRVQVQAKLSGVEAGRGYWGLGDWSEAFTIGDSHVSTIDNNAHRMIVTSNGKQLYNWPTSLGVPSKPTISGTLVVWYHQYDVLMDSLTLSPPIPRNAPFGYYDHVYWDTAISTDGFFVHAAPWSVAQQGRTNVSHGCVNLTTAEAQTFYQWSLVGDVVQIKNTLRVADSGDGEGDWQIPFAQYANSQGVTADTTTSSNPGGV